MSYVEAVLRTYNSFGRRDNIYKARIKILVHELGAEAFAKEVDAEWQSTKDGALALDPAVLAEIAARFTYPDYLELGDSPPTLAQARRADRGFDGWMGNSVANHKVPGYAIVTISLKPEGGTPGDATAEQMDAIADLADRYSSARSASATSRISFCRMSRSAICRNFTARSMRSALPSRMSG